MKRRTLSPHPPKALRSAQVRFDNLAIVPASLLPNKVSYQKYANTLPRGQVLLIIPRTSSVSLATFERVAASLEAKGRRVRRLPVEHFRAAPRSAPLAGDQSPHPEQ